MADLTEALGVNRPSLYAAFGNKEALFRRAVERYVEGPAGYIEAALKAPTARDVAERMLRGAVELIADPKRPRGCLIVQGALTCGEGAEPIRRELRDRRREAEARLRRRLRRARAEGDLPAEADPAELARYLWVVIQGMAVQASGGAGRGELMRVVKWAMRVWPT
jgi:AcrR family transcriptional regulator